MKYKSGDVQRILGIPVETLRFFENKGLITPQRDINNNYRYFDTLDLNKIIAYKLYRSFEFSLEDSVHMVRCDNDTSLDMLNKQINTIESKFQYYQNLYERIQDVKKSFEHTKHLIGTYEIKERPELLLYDNQVNDQFEKDEKRIQTTKNWLEYLPFIHIAIHISKDTMVSNDDVHFGYALETKYQNVVQAVKNDLSEVYPSKKCIHTIVQSTNKNPLSTKTFAPIIDEMIKKGQTLEGDIIGWIINEEDLGDEKVRYFECWIPYID
ncbi:DNA-binding transcriptional MerR regulator [Natranaerovirga hydrolytica]|uniref:DNA-binding transcriptional MerR regulator n=1 Tax=Natranaerovirga hydrolytica TaxID=680378 RepID=A0A4V2PZN2_9FIRM|nr:MerR family transcriptional regulator [Natranaerovirga hydrolytica]TCK90521.1 DNA-binding transcriptional MerR regulator [Natranaerovirga hydrolytica]